MSAAVAIRRAIPSPSGAARRAAREQSLVAAAQIASGVGNLVFALAMARVLAPSAFAELVAFLALFLLVFVPARSLAAGSALAPELASRARRRALGFGLAASAGIVAAGLPLAGALALSPALVAALAAAPPLAGVLELERGRLVGERRHGWLAASLLAEPGARIGAGIALALAFGAPGAAAGVVLGSVAALGVARAGGGTRNGTVAADTGSTAKRTRAAIAAFLLIALVQSQDVVFANASLPTADAARFAVLSTLGGIAAFATATVPLVLIPRARERDPGALGAALAVAAALGGGAVLATLVVPASLIGAAFGDEYADLAGLAPKYMLAMALLGVARVLAANGVTIGRRVVPAAIAAAAVLQLGLLVAIGDSAGGVATATLASTAALAVALGGAQALRRRPAGLVEEAETDPALEPEPEPESEDEPEPEPPRRDRSEALRTVAIIGLLIAVGAGARMLVDRSLWLDEATSWYQSQLPFGVMLADLRATDVHPPGYHAVLWLAVQAFGDSELGLRLPSLIAGLALIPMLFVSGRALYDRRTGMIAAALGAVAPILVWYSQEARMYAQLMLFALIAVWALHQALETGRRRYWLAFALASAAVAWTHYMAILLVVVLAAFAALGISRRWRETGDRTAVVRALGAGVLIAALAAPLAPFAIDQFTANEAAGKGFDQPQAAGGPVDTQVSLYAALTNGLWAVFGYHSNATMERLAALWPMLVLLALLCLGRGRSRSTTMLATGVALPAVLLTGLAFGHPFLFELRYNLAAVPLIVLLGARAVGTWPKAPAGRVALAGVAIAALSAAMVDQAVNGRNPRVYDFAGALGEISRRADSNDLVLYSPVELNNVIDYYGPDLEKARVGEGLPPEAEKADRVFLLSSFRDDERNVQSAGATLERLRDDRELEDQFSRAQVRVWEFR